MNFIQTVWNVLIGENKIVMDIICTPLTFIEIFLYMKLFLSIVNIDSTRKQRILFVMLFSIISLFNMYFGVMPYNNLINALVLPLLIILVFKTSILKGLLAEIITYIVVIVISASLLPLYTKIFNTTASATSLIPIHKLCFSGIFYAFLYLVYKITTHFNIHISLVDKFKIKNEIIFILNLLIGSFSIGFEYFILFNYIEFIPNSLVGFSLFVLLAYFFVSIFSLIRTNKLEITTQSLEEQKMYNKTLSTLHDNIRGFKHDFNNIVQAIGGYLGTNNIDGLKAYYKDLLEECQLNNNLSLLNPELVNNPAIYSILCDKLCRSQEKGIKFNLEVYADLSNLNAKPFELTRILGILFDNAIDAASKCDKKIVNVTFKNDKSKNKTLVIIQNTYINKDINLSRIFEKGFSSKDEGETSQNHGLGLWEVKKYLEKNTDLDLYTTKTDEFFTQQFEIYNS